MNHDPDFPFMVIDQTGGVAKFKTASDAGIFAERILGEVIETHPEN